MRLRTPAKFVLDENASTGTLTLKGVDNDRVERIVSAAFDEPTKIVRTSTATSTPRSSEPRA